MRLSPVDGAEIELRTALNSKIIEADRRKNLTHAQVATLALTSRTRITAILNRNTKPSLPTSYFASSIPSVHG